MRRKRRQYLGEGLVDGLRPHVVPALLGAGLPLLGGAGATRRDLEPVRVVATPLATHLKYRLVSRGDGRTGAATGP
ncbi:hypothetical protein OG613_08665 [Streptomyces sp. NBC_00015]|uniref:hypothetical protein n=1 Tax=unclassified Streptomyces TaxID=2593676 RepID=UPI00225727E3|nr:hypothetical protein [Streptomyces sp. NBC_00103]MCX5374280.1 hypothetical protein [Streptomyces sp. NBC_00103]